MKSSLDLRKIFTYRPWHRGKAALARAGAVLAGVVLVFASASAQVQPQAQNSGLAVPQRIVVLVNDEPISAYDVVQRLRLTIASIGGVRDEQQFTRLQEQVVRNMVDDKLKLQEAKNFELVISDEEANDAFRRQAESLNQTPEEFEATLLRMGVAKDSYLEQMKAEIAWGELVNGRLGRFASVSDDEVEHELARLKASAGQPEYHLAEIFLLVDNIRRETEIRATAERIVAQIRAGGRFEGFAEQFSQSATAAAGGDMGWVTLDLLSPELAKVVQSLPLDGVSDPIRTGGGYYILQLRDRRRVLEADPLDEQLDVRQVFLPLDLAQASEAEQVAAVDRIEAAQKGIHSCDDIGSFAARLGNASHGSLGKITLRELPGGLRRLIEGVEIGQPTKPARMQDGFRIFFVCDRTKPEVKMPSYDDIADQLERQKLAMMARRYLRDLRRDAIVDYR